MRDQFTALPADPNIRHSFAERLWSKVAERESGCWEWQAAKTRGYGQLEFVEAGVRRNVKAHRAAYELVRGPIPRGLHLDHLCRNPGCINPDHLEPVTNAENARRGIAGQCVRERQAAKTHCPVGHPYAETEYRAPKTGYRHCKACARDANKRWRDRQKLNREWQ